MEDILVQKHKETMSILNYCNNIDENRDLLKIFQGLHIDKNGVPHNQEMFDQWASISQQMEDKSIRDLTVIFLEQMQEKYFPLLKNTVSVVKSLPDEEIARLQSVKVNYWNRADIRIEQDYKDMFKILDHCYFQTHNDDLGVLLGSLSTGVWADGLPADLADYELWLNSVEAIKDNDIITKIIAFLNQFGFSFKTYDLAPTISFVQSLSEEQIKKITQSNNGKSQE